MTDEIPWLRAGDKPFDAGPDWFNNACVGWGRCHEDLYVRGYERAAEVLIDRVSGSGGDADVLIYPIVFLYRHHLELRLKQIIRLGHALFHEKTQLPHSHGLVVLWRKCRPMLERFWPNAPRGDLDAV